MKMLSDTFLYEPSWKSHAILIWFYFHGIHQMTPVTFMFGGSCRLSMCEVFQMIKLMLFGEMWACCNGNEN